MQIQYIVKLIWHVSDWLSYAGEALIKVTDPAGSSLQVYAILAHPICILIDSQWSNL